MAEQIAGQIFNIQLVEISLSLEDDPSVHVTPNDIKLGLIKIRL